VNGEEALLVSHLSAFSFIGADNVKGTSFQKPMQSLKMILKECHEAL